MEKRNQKGNYFFNEEGQSEVSEQIMDAYNSGVIEQSAENHNMTDDEVAEGEI